MTLGYDLCQCRTSIVFLPLASVGPPAALEVTKLSLFIVFLLLPRWCSHPSKSPKLRYLPCPCPCPGGVPRPRRASTRVPTEHQYGSAPAQGKLMARSALIKLTRRTQMTRKSWRRNTVYPNQRAHALPQWPEGGLARWRLCTTGPSPTGTHDLLVRWLVMRA